MCELTEKHEPIAEEARAKVIGVGRDAENDKALVVYFDKPPSDGGLRGLHEMLRAKDELDRIRKGLRLIGYVPVDELSRLETTIRPGMVGARKSRAAARRVPLSPYARELIETLRRSGAGDGPVFGLGTAQIDALFRRARDRCGIQDLHWHDSRATAITRLARRVDILDLARMIGHANLGELRTYYRERAEDIAARAWG